jgi:hypothetical protein
MTIKEAADTLQELIDEKMQAFESMGKKARDMKQKLDKLHLQMGKILIELEPVDSMIRAQHPEKVELFELLKDIAEKHNG